MSGKAYKNSTETLEQFNETASCTYKSWAPNIVCINKAELDSKISALNYAFEQAAENHLEKKPKNEKDHKRSTELETLFKGRQECKDEQRYDGAKKITNKIRKQLRKERLEKTINELEDNLWHDIKKAKTAFVPSHTKLLNKDKKPCTSDERPEILADYYENEQWAIDDTREKETTKSRVPPHLDLPHINVRENSA